MSFIGYTTPRGRNRLSQHPMLALNHQSRHALSRVLKRRTLKEDILSFYARQVDGLPHIPSYLADTVYAQLVKQQLDLFDQRHTRKTTVAPCVAKRVQNIVQGGDERMELSIHDYTTNNTNTNSERRISVQEYADLEALLTQDNYNLALAVHDLRLPTAWDLKAKGDHVEVSTDRLQLTFRGNGKDDADVSSVRANHAMRKQCGIYYYEVEVISKGMDGHIGIGFCRRINSLDRFPGWEEHSWGYHGENGNTYSGPGTQKSYGPKFGTGDIIGCGIDFRDMSAFYTKNGIYLGTAFKKIKETDIYPFVGFKTPGERIEANFGSKPFKFDIQQYMSNERRDLFSAIADKSIEATTPTRKSHLSTINDFVANEISDKVVIEYLRHHGYSKSAKALASAIQLKSNTDISEQLDSEALHRQEIRNCILEGDIDKAILLCHTHYPEVLTSNPWVEFKLQCRKFMEMVRKVQHGLMASLAANEEYEIQNLDITKKGSKRTTSKANLDYHNKKRKKQRMNDHAIGNIDCFQEVMAFGNQLKRQYGPEAEENDLMKSELLVTFSTLAYADLSNRAVSYLYEPSHIEIVASELNSAILVSLNKYPNSSLERIYRQTTTTIQELVLCGNAKAAFLEPERDCLKSNNL